MHIFVFFVITGLWMLEFIYRQQKNQQSPVATKPLETYTLSSIFVSVVCTIIVTLTARELHIAQLPEFTIWIGLLVYAIGVSLRWWGILLLGTYFSRHIVVNSTMQLVSTGPYRVLRHPLYSGLLLCALGIPIALGTWLGLLPGLVLVVPILLYRIKIEERHMLQVLGITYEQWSKQRWRLFPYVY